MRIDNDWESLYEKGLCHMNIKDYETSLMCFQHAHSIQPNEHA
jgi:tetratricopeptide (TPR) repeat protein